MQVIVFVEDDERAVALTEHLEESEFPVATLTGEARPEAFQEIFQVPNHSKF